MANNKNAGKGMTPKKGYNQKNYNDNYDLIDWDKNRPLITVKIDKNTTGILYDETIDGRTEEINRPND